MAARRKNLRPVAEGEKAPAPARELSVTEAAEEGSPRGLLVAMRTRVAKAVEDPNTPARDLAALTKRLMELQRDIDAYDARAKQEDDDRAEQVEDGSFDASAV